MTRAAMASGSSILDFLQMPLGQFFDICRAIAEIMDERNKK